MKKKIKHLQVSSHYFKAECNACDGGNLGNGNRLVSSIEFFALNPDQQCKNCLDIITGKRLDYHGRDLKVIIP